LAYTNFQGNAHRVSQDDAVLAVTQFCQKPHEPKRKKRHHSDEDVPRKNHNLKKQHEKVLHDKHDEMPEEIQLYKQHDKYDNASIGELQPELNSRRRSVSEQTLSTSHVLRRGADDDDETYDNHDKHVDVIDDYDDDDDVGGGSVGSYIDGNNVSYNGGGSNVGVDNDNVRGVNTDVDRGVTLAAPVPPVPPVSVPPVSVPPVSKTQDGLPCKVQRFTSDDFVF